MASLSEEFAKSRPKPKYFIGDRVCGRLGKVPWVGTVLVDNMVNATEGSFVHIWLDLPMKLDGEHTSLLKLSSGSRSIQRIVEIDENISKKDVKKPRKRAQVV